MSFSERDRSILRDCAKNIADIAALPVMDEKRELWRRVNALERTRPPIMLWNDTWHATSDEIDLECEDEGARGQECNFKRLLYHWEHMKDDTVYDGKLYSGIVIRQEGKGLIVDTDDPDHAFGSKRFNAVLDDDVEPEAVIDIPKVTVDWGQTEDNYETLNELYGDILTVEKRGVAGYWFAIMDDFIKFRGLENMFMDMIDRPEWVHSWMERMTQCQESRAEQLESLGVLSLNNRADSVGPGGLGMTDELPKEGFDGEHVRRVDQWSHATTQIFSEVSPSMHDEFALTYEKRFLEQFGLAGYGCCEPLHHKLDIIKKIKNVRRISMSPWVDVALGAEGLGNEYVFSYKPNPAIIGMETWDVDLARDQLRDTFEKTRGCIVEAIMKDLHECRGEPDRMWEWVDMAMQLSEEFAE